MEVCVEKLSEGSLSMVMKFSENYGCVLWQEPGYCTSNDVSLQNKRFKIPH
jgi:hypothetical protein